MTPTVAPAGFTGVVVANGTGSVNFTPAETGNGVYFLNCCVNSNNAYYKFTGSTVGDIFNTSEARQIAFYLKSRYSFAGKRVRNTSGMRYAFDVTDGNGKHPVLFSDASARWIVVLQLRDIAGTSPEHLFAAGDGGLRRSAMG